MCPVTMPLTYIQSDCQLCILFVMLVSLLSFSLPVWTCVYAFVCMHAYTSGKCTAHKLQFTQILLSFMGCLHAFLYSCLLAIPIHSLYSVFIYMEMLLHRWYSCIAERIDRFSMCRAELKLGEMRMNDLFKWPRPASLIHSIPDTQNTCDHALSLKCTKSYTIYSKIEQIVHLALLFHSNMVI